MSSHHINEKTQLREIRLIFIFKATLLVSGIARIRNQGLQMTTFSGFSNPTWQEEHHPLQLPLLWPVTHFLSHMSHDLPSTQFIFVCLFVCFSVCWLFNLSYLLSSQFWPQFEGRFLGYPLLKLLNNTTLWWGRLLPSPSTCVCKWVPPSQRPACCGSSLA